MSRRSYLLSLLACLAGAGLAAYAATRTWSLVVTARPGMSDLRTVRTGTDVAPWLIGLALVALAGTGALLAPGGRLRRGLGVLLALVGVLLVVAAAVARAGLDTGRAGVPGTLWPIACALGGAIVAVGGLTAARHGHRWPRMSARYERRTVPAAQPRPGGGSRPSPAAGPDARTAAPVDNRAAWDALDRGDDPTD